MTATILLNSGRVSTQSIYSAISNSNFSGVVDHEPIGAAYRPATVLRDMEVAKTLASENQYVSSAITKIDGIIKAGDPYVSIGWTNFSWADFFLDRWGDQVKFAALVRCPYETSASLLTHRFFLGRDDIYAREAIITNKNKIFYRDLAQRYGRFTPFEKLIFHWCELYRYILEFQNRQSFKIWHFENIRSNQDAWNLFITSLCGDTSDAKQSEYKDKYQIKIKHRVRFAVRKELAAVCKELCRELGYDNNFINGLDAKTAMLKEKYTIGRGKLLSW